jgi:LDH2 family malate/lactate/ureidoglycolate dehydrogenase
VKFRDKKAINSDQETGMKVTFEQLKEAFNRVLLARGIAAETADACAEMFARTTESGVYSHGVNRFPLYPAAGQRRHHP